MIFGPGPKIALQILRTTGKPPPPLPKEQKQHLSLAGQLCQPAKTISPGGWGHAPHPPTNQPTHLSTRGGFPPQKVNTRVQAEVPTGTLTQPFWHPAPPSHPSTPPPPHMCVCEQHGHPTCPACTVTYKGVRHCCAMGHLGHPRTHTPQRVDWGDVAPARGPWEGGWHTQAAKAQQRHPPPNTYPRICVGIPPRVHARTHKHLATPPPPWASAHPRSSTYVTHHATQHPPRHAAPRSPRQGGTAHPYPTTDNTRHNPYPCTPCLGKGMQHAQQGHKGEGRGFVLRSPKEGLSVGIWRRKVVMCRHRGKDPASGHPRAHQPLLGRGTSPPASDGRLDAPGQRRRQLPSSVWTRRREVK